MKTKILIVIYFIAISVLSAGNAQAAFEIKGNPNFNSANLPPEVKIWYDRMWSSINNQASYTDTGLNPALNAASNNTYQYGRTMNIYITSLLHVFRVTGDLRILDEVDRLAEIMRTKLKDSSILTRGGTTYQSDGYLNWIWQYSDDPLYVGTDVHEMDDIMAHSLVASFAYALDANKNVPGISAERATRYAAHADFWENYLKNHFEAKWRKRKNITWPNFPFLTKRLTHPYAQWTRYNYYMHKLTGQQAYYDEAVEMARNLDRQIVEVDTPLGKALQWNHGMTFLGASDLGMQPTNYSRYTIQAIQDLYMEGFHFNREFMDKMGNMFSHFVIDSLSPQSFTYRIDGTGDSTSRMTSEVYRISPFHFLGAYDKSGEIISTSNAVYSMKETIPEKPKYIQIPAGRILSYYLNNPATPVSPNQTPTPTPTTTPTPTPQTQPTPVPIPIPTSQPEPSVEPTPTPTPNPEPEPTPQPLPIKYNRDDFNKLFPNWSKNGTGLQGDLNNDGKVNAKDLGIMMSNWE